MTMKNDAKFDRELTFQFKIDMRNLTKFDPSTQKSQKMALYRGAFDHSIYCLSSESTAGLPLMAIKIYTKFEGKLTDLFFQK